MSVIQFNKLAIDRRKGCRLFEHMLINKHETHRIIDTNNVFIHLVIIAVSFYTPVFGKSNPYFCAL
jgi:hypothetical protein